MEFRLFDFGSGVWFGCFFFLRTSEEVRVVFRDGWGETERRRRWVEVWKLFVLGIVVGVFLFREVGFDNLERGSWISGIVYSL